MSSYDQYQRSLVLEYLAQVLTQGYLRERYLSHKSFLEMQDYCS